MWCLVIIIVTGIHLPAFSYFNLYRACQAYEHNDIDGARELFGATAACDTKNWKALFNLGTIALNEQEYEDAIKHFDKVLEIRPDCKEARERRDIAAEALKKEREEQEKQKEEQQKQERDNKQQEKQKNQDRDQKKDQQKNDEQDNDQDREKDNESNGEENNKKSESSSTSNKDHEEKRRNEQQQNNGQQELNKQQKNAQDKSQGDQQNKQEAKGDEQKDAQQKLDYDKHLTNPSKPEQKNDTSTAQCTEDPSKKEDGWSNIELTEREKEIVKIVEDTDKVAQQYMMMHTRKARQHGPQKDW